MENSLGYAQINEGWIFGVVLYTIQHNSIARRYSIVHLRRNTEDSSSSVQNTLNQEETCRTHWDMHKSTKDGFKALCCTPYNISALPADPRSSICGRTLRTALRVSRTLLIKRKRVELIGICTNQWRMDQGTSTRILDRRSAPGDLDADA
jgi:hypothetical protein